MNNIIKQIEIDLYTPTFYEVIKAQQNDENSRFVEFILYNQGEPYVIPENVLIKLEGQRANKSPFMKPCTVANNVVTVELDKDLLYYSGVAHLKLVIYKEDGNSVLSTIPFTVSIQKNPLDSNKFEKDNYSLVHQLVLQTETNTKNLNNEIKRAKEAEKVITDNLNAEIARAKKAESDEATRATNAEKVLTDNLSAEITRAKNAESANATAINNEVTRAKAAEKVNSDNISANTTAINNEITRAKNAESNLDSKKANIDSPTFTGIPKAPTASAGTNTTQVATTAFVQTAVSNLVDSAPETMDTLDELAKALGDDPNFATTVANQIGTKANASDLTSHTNNKSNPHGVTKSQVGLSNVPNVATNDQTPSYTEATTLTKLTSGEKLSVAFGKISKAVTDLIAHVGDSVKHITSSERTLWNTVSNKVEKVSGKGLSSNDYTDEDKNKLDNLTNNINNSLVTGVKGNAESTYRTGKVNITPANIGLGNVDNTADCVKNVATASLVNGVYTGNGGQQPPSYVTAAKTRFNMMSAFKGITNPAGGYMDTILMDNYIGSDVPYVTGIGITKNNGNPRVFFANGAKGNTTTWAHQVEAITTGNISSQSVFSATKAIQDENGKNIASTYIKKIGSNEISGDLIFNGDYGIGAINAERYNNGWKLYQINDTMSGKDQQRTFLDITNNDHENIVSFAIRANGKQLLSIGSNLNDDSSYACVTTGSLSLAAGITTTRKSNTYLEANQGRVIINALSNPESFNMLDRLISTNGYFTDGVYGNRRVFHYTSRATVDAGINAVNKTLILLDESGNSSFPGDVSIAGKVSIAYPNHLAVRHIDGAAGSELLLQYDNIGQAIRTYGPVLHHSGTSYYLAGTHCAFENIGGINSSAWSNAPLFLYTQTSENTATGGRPYIGFECRGYSASSFYYDTDGYFHSILSTGGAYRIDMTSVSDKRMKNDLGLLSTTDEDEILIDNIDIHKFTYKNDNDKTIHYGMIAQDVRDVLIKYNIGYRPFLQINHYKNGRDNTPEMSNDLYVNEEECTYNMDYKAFIPVLWHLVKKCRTKIKEQENKIAEQSEILQHQSGIIDELTRRIEKLESCISVK